MAATRPGDRLILHARVVTGAGGGPEKTIINSPRFLVDQGYPMICAYMRDPADRYFADLEARAVEKGAEIVPIDDAGPLDRRVWQQFRALCAARRPAIWHGHEYKSNLLGPLLRRHHPMKLVTTLHGWVKHTWKTPLYYALDRWSLRHYDHVICVSEDLHRAALAAGVPAACCTYVANGIDTDEYARTRSPLAARQAVRAGLTGQDRLSAALPGAGLPERLVLGAVGRLSPEKGFDLLIRAFAAAQRDTGVDAELWIIGEGDELPALERLVAELGMAGRVSLPGFRRDMIGLFEAMDLFVLSSIREGLPNVVLEAMAMGVPVLATRVAGVPSLIEDGVNGRLIDTASEAQLATGLRELLGDAGLRARLAGAARSTIEHGYGFAQRMQRIKAIYDDVLAG